MTLVEIFVLLIIAALCGAAGQAIVGVSRGGCLASIGIGLLGAVLGTWLARQIGLPEVLAIDIGGTPFPIVWAILGSVVLVGLLALVQRGRN